MAEQATFVVQTKPEHYEVRQAPLPDIGADDALLALEGCGVCGLESEIDVEHLEEATEKQAGADEQHAGEGDL